MSRLWPRPSLAYSYFHGGGPGFFAAHLYFGDLPGVGVRLSLSQVSLAEKIYGKLTQRTVFQKRCNVSSLKSAKL